VSRGVHDDHLLALLLKHGHGSASGQRGGGESRPGDLSLVGSDHQVASDGDPHDQGDGRRRHRQQEA
jgi:hypothetical protein